MKQPNNTKTKIYSTALYMRLSRDDENFGDSVSIETQRTILQKFAAENGLRVYGEYVDDGWSGTNFDRPSFQRMSCARKKPRNKPQLPPRTSRYIVIATVTPGFFSPAITIVSISLFT